VIDLIILSKIELFTTTYMFTVVVFVHFIQYPMLKNVPEQSRADYNKKYCDRSGFVIAPAMIFEAFSALMLALINPNFTSYFGLSLIIFIWLDTFLLSVPAHAKLCKSWDEKAYDKLMRSNLIRLIAWAIRCLILFYL